MSEMFPAVLSPNATNGTIEDWVAAVANHTRPAQVHFCDGSEAEISFLEKQMVADGTLLPLNSQYPGSFLHRTSPSDVARTENSTFICSDEQIDAGPTNNWMSPHEAQTKIWPIFADCMRTRTMYVVPYLMGPSRSEYSRVGIQITDSPYVVASLRIMTRMGDAYVSPARLRSSPTVVRGLHSLGTLDEHKRYIAHFPQTQTIWSINSGYGGNALLSKKCHALRLASVQGHSEGWLAEHMLVAGVTNPQGVKHYFAAAFPSGCGKTNLAMLVSALPDWKIETIGDDICWMRVAPDGRLWAINPEHGMFGVAPGTSLQSNPSAFRAIQQRTIFTNVALRRDDTPWWEGYKPLSPDEELDDWRGQPWKEGSAVMAAHPNARFTTPLRMCPSIDPNVDDPRGVPISAIIFGGRRSKLAPLVYEARDWNHGVYMGATIVSETTAASTGDVGVLRNDPMAMLPFCGYNMGDYFAHWLDIGKRLSRPPKIFHVNWFRTDQDGRFLWPGFGANIHVLRWILSRLDGSTEAHATPIGFIPNPQDIGADHLNMPPELARKLLEIDAKTWQSEASRNKEFLGKFGARLPPDLWAEHSKLVDRLVHWEDYVS